MTEDSSERSETSEQHASTAAADNPQDATESSPPDSASASVQSGNRETKSAATPSKPSTGANTQLPPVTEIPEDEDLWNRTSRKHSVTHNPKDKLTRAVLRRASIIAPNVVKVIAPIRHRAKTTGAGIDTGVVAPDEEVLVGEQQQLAATRSAHRRHSHEDSFEIKREWVYAFFVAVGLWLAMLTTIVMYLAYRWTTYEKEHDADLEHGAHSGAVGSTKNDSLTPEQVYEEDVHYLVEKVEEMSVKMKRKMLHVPFLGTVLLVLQPVFGALAATVGPVVGPMFMAVLNNLPGAMTVLRNVMRWWPLVFTTMKVRQLRMFLTSQLHLGQLLGRVGRVFSGLVMKLRRVPAVPAVA